MSWAQKRGGYRGYKGGMGGSASALGQDLHTSYSQPKALTSCASGPCGCTHLSLDLPLGRDGVA